MVKYKDLNSETSELIPGFSQLLSKRVDQFSKEFWPSHYSKAKGTYIWDMNEKKYLDFSFSGIGANVLGYSDPDIDKAVIKSVKMGTSSSINPIDELEFAKAMTKLHPWSDMVRTSRSGGEAVSIAIRLARTYTNKSKILFCGYHGWSDWYLAANLASKSNLDNHLLPSLTSRGVPKELANTAFPFNFNDLSQFKKLFKENLDDLAGVIMEPARSELPDQEFLSSIRESCTEHNIPFIFDEISSGFRLCNGGAHLKIGVEPDIAVFAKALGNGYPISAIIGKKEFMSSAEDSFISSTNWTERIGPVAGIALIKKFVSKDVSVKLCKFGKDMQSFWHDMNKEYDLNLNISGIYPLSSFSFLDDNDLKKTFFIEYMLKQNILACNRYYPNYAQTKKDQDIYFKSADKAFRLISKYDKSGKLANKIDGSISKSGFKRYA